MGRRFRPQVVSRATFDALLREQGWQYRWEPVEQADIAAEVEAAHQVENERLLRGGVPLCPICSGPTHDEYVPCSDQCRGDALAFGREPQ